MDKKLIELIIYPLIFLIFLFIVIYFIFISKDAFFEEIIRVYGPLGLFIGSIFANASIVLPLPIDIFVFLLAHKNFFGLGLFDLALIGMIVGLGAAIGEMTAYFLGLLTSRGLREIESKAIKRKLEEIKENIKYKGMFFIVIAALVPFPFDFIGIAAGLLRYDAKKFFIAAFIGKSIKFTLIGLAGFYSISFLKVFFHL